MPRGSGSFKIRIFSYEINLKFYSFNGNSIKSLNTNSFTTFSYLETVYMSDNGIEAIERNFFDNFPAVKNVYADGNSCINYMFQGITNVSSILSVFETCFLNWEFLQETTTTTTTTEVTPTTTTEVISTTSATPIGVINRRIPMILILIFVVTVFFF